MKPVDKYSAKLRKLFKKVPLLFYLFCSEKHEHKALKRFVGFSYGIFLGILFYNFILVDLNFTEDAAFIVGTTICMMLGFGIAFSSQIRCITCLTFPSFGGKVGRSVLKAMVVAFIISGPVENLANNGKEVVRVFACTASLTFNLTKTRFELMFKPFTQAIFGMKTDVNEVKDTLRSIKDVSAPITGELEDETEMKKMKEENDYLDELMGDTKRSVLAGAKYETKGEVVEAERYEKQYLKKIELRCESQFTRASKKCRDMFESAYNKCYDTGGSSRCDPSKEMDPGFGEGYAYLKQSRSSLSKNFKDVKLQYKIGKVKQLRDLRDARDTAVAVLHTVKKSPGEAHIASFEEDREEEIGGPSIQDTFKKVKERKY
ncbi:hypothetical protein NQ314_000128 [Rhamnusium bicolor]|uniref:Uncharacterized protein n=1 Tax=Rhamnusium bicolor TaxID=1586634 RepID=A0AAV8ZVM8_9CUCU|nr:hypothetical protein NQ314_000128 [Rhamnusium bicolor]